MTKQEAFNKVWNVFVTQGLTPCQIGTHCMYYHKDAPPGMSSACAVGVLLPKETAKKMEQADVGGITAWSRTLELDPETIPSAHREILQELISTLGTDFLSDLQLAHDDPPSPWCVELTLRNIAKAWNLSIPS